MDIKNKEMIVNFGALNYNIKKIATILELDIEEVQKEFFENQESELRALFEKGKAMAEYAIDLKLFEMAKGGDLKALEKYEMRQLNK